MSILGNFMATLRAEEMSAPAPHDDYWYMPRGGSSATGMMVTPESAKRLATVISCVNKIAKTLAMLPLKMYQEQSDGGKSVATNHPLYEVLYLRPSQQQSAFEWRQMMQGHLELRGNAYSEIVPGPRGAVDQLVPMHPDRVTPDLLSSGRIRYRYSDPLTNQTRTLAQEEVFHLRNFMDDGVVGQSTIALGLDTFGLALAAQDYYARFLRNDAKPGIILTGANFKNKIDENEFKENWQKTQTGANRFKAAVLPNGMDVKTIGINSSDAQLIEARKLSRIEICSMFDVPPHLVGEADKAATYASVEQFNIMFAVYCILPRLILWEQAIQRSLITAPRYSAKFNMTALLRGDTASRFNAYKIAIENGWMSQDEVRILEEMNPIPNGDGAHYWRPLNWARLGDVQNPGQAEGNNSGAAEGMARVDKRLMVLAISAAERCVRKETAAVSKLIERHAAAREFTEFYATHAGFIAEVLRIPEDRARAYCDKRCAYVSELARQGVSPDVLPLDSDGQTTKLTVMAVGGLQ